jgi:hypothetical protein
MAEYRFVFTRMWREDDWFASLDAERKMLWMYLFTNPSASVCGMYALSVRVAANETGLSQEKVRQVLADFVRAGKVSWDGVVIWVHKMRGYQATKSDKVKVRIDKDIAATPDTVVKLTYLRAYGIDTLCIPRRTETETGTGTGTETETDADKKRIPSSLPPQPKQDEDEPLLERMQQHEVTYSVAVTLIAGKEALATAWLNYADAHPNIPNVGAFLTKNIRAGRMPPNGHSPPGKPPPRAISGLSEADLEVQRELQRAKAQPTTSGPAPPA